MNETWAILELLGHVRTGGKVSETEMFGTKMGRIDIPKPDGGFTTQFFSGGAVYRMTPCGEAEARAVAANSQPEPIHAWEMPRGLPGTRPTREEFRPEFGDDEEDEDEDE